MHTYAMYDTVKEKRTGRKGSVRKVKGDKLKIQFEGSTKIETLHYTLVEKLNR